MNFFHIDPIKALLYSAVANGIVAPVILVLIVKMSSSPKIMKEWVNKPITEAFGWYITILMGVVAVAAIVSLFI